MNKTMMWNPQPDGCICIPSYCIPSYAPGAGGTKATPRPSGGSGGGNRTACQTYTRAHPDGQMDGCGWSAGGNGYKGV